MSPEFIQTVLGILKRAVVAMGMAIDPEDWDFAFQEFGRVFEIGKAKFKAEFDGNATLANDTDWELNGVYLTIKARLLAKLVDSHREIVAGLLEAAKEIVIAAAKEGVKAVL